MKALIWKDWMLVRPLLIAAGVFYAIPFLIWSCAVLFFGELRPPNFTEAVAGTVGLSGAGCLCAQLANPMYSAVMFARERRERTAELYSTMPLSRARVVISKLAVACAAALAPWIFTALVFLVTGLVLSRWSGDELSLARSFDSGDGELWGFIYAFAGMATLSVGMGWFLSSVLRSEVAAGGIALFITIATAITIAMVLSRMKLIDLLGVKPYYLVSAPLGFAGLVAGTVVSLKRKTP